MFFFLFYLYAYTRDLHSFPTRRSSDLSGPAMALLNDLPRYGEYVFPGTDPNRPRHDLQRPWAAIAKRAALSGLRLHDLDRKSTRLNSSHTVISYAVFCLKKKKNQCTHR